MRDFKQEQQGQLDGCAVRLAFSVIPLAVGTQWMTWGLGEGQSPGPEAITAVQSGLWLGPARRPGIWGEDRDRQSHWVTVVHSKSLAFPGLSFPIWPMGLWDQGPTPLVKNCRAPRVGRLLGWLEGFRLDPGYRAMPFSGEQSPVDLEDETLGGGGAVQDSISSPQAEMPQHEWKGPVS